MPITFSMILRNGEQLPDEQRHDQTDNYVGKGRHCAGQHIGPASILATAAVQSFFSPFRIVRAAAGLIRQFDPAV